MKRLRRTFVLLWLVVVTYLGKESCCFMQRDHTPHHVRPRNPGRHKRASLFNFEIGDDR